MSEPTYGPGVITIADEIVAFLRRFVVFTSDAQADAIALWILHTHAFDTAYATPYLYVHSAEKQSGKTRVIEVVSTLARHAVVTASTSSAAMFRLIAQDKPTLFIDEVDAVFTGAANEDLRGVLNSGYKRNGTVLRFTGTDTESFSTFCPKLLAGIDNGALPDTIADRCIPITLKRKKTDVTVERWIWRKVEDDAVTLSERIAAWAAENFDALLDAEPTIIEEISDRSFEISEPLLAIADRLGGWHQRGRDAIIALLTVDDDVKLSRAAQVLAFSREYMETHRTDRIASKVLMDQFGLHGKVLGTMLKPYGISSRGMTIDGLMAKGYLKADMQDAWDRYL